MSEPDDVAKKIAKGIESAEIVIFPTAARPAMQTLHPADFDTRGTPGDRSDPVAASSAPAAADPPRSGEEASSRSGGLEPASGGMRRGDDGGGDDIDLKLARFPLTDLGNAERFAARNKGLLLYCPALGWLWWDGKRWSAHGAEEIVKIREHECVRAIQDEAAALAESVADWMTKPPSVTKDGDEKNPPRWRSDEVASWGRMSESAARMASISKRAGAMLAIDVTKLDADPMKINVQNGTLRVAKVEDGDYVTLHPHDPLDYITKIAPVMYRPEAEAPLFKRFLDRIQPLEQDGMQRFLAQWFGYSLTGDVGEQKLVFFYGKGRNGKGVLVNLMSEIAGDYAASIGIETFLDSGNSRAGGQATPDRAKLPGVRLLTTSEPKKGATIDDGFVKLITGGDPIDARHLNKDFFQFRPVLKLTMQGNYRPKLPGVDEGIKGRVVLVPFGVFIPPEERDKRLGEKLKAEYSGVLNWMLDGLRDWLDAGLVQPGVVRTATEEYFSDNDPLGRFLEACTEQAMGERVQSSEMYAVFAAWAKANGESEWSSKGFSNALKERGLAKIKNDFIFWIDIKLTKRVSDLIDHDGKPVRAHRAAGPDDEWPEVR